MSGNHFLRSMAEPVGRGAESTTDDPTPEVHFAETVSVVTEVNNLAEAPLVDVPLELTTPDDAEGAKTNAQLRRSASRDRDMKDEEGLVLKAVPREASEEPTMAAETAKVADGVENLEITPSSNGTKKRKLKEGNTNSPAPQWPVTDELYSQNEHVPADTDEKKPQPKTRRGSNGGRKRGPNKAKDTATIAENEPAQGLRRSKRRKST
ncbi:hypothetical protein FRC09_013737 [Ceratobasidium sp. 395]|nr:hypothetical protein FRC09_013737 [Ceratobasidium sp. 395]